MTDYAKILFDIKRLETSLAEVNDELSGLNSRSELIQVTILHRTCMALFDGVKPDVDDLKKRRSEVTEKIKPLEDEKISLEKGISELLETK